MARFPFLTAERGMIFRLTHVANVPWILEHGIHCRSASLLDPSFKDIGNAELIQKRATRAVRTGGSATLADYIAFYFTPGSPMLYNILTGFGVLRREREEIAILVSSIGKLDTAGAEYLISDRHAYLAAARFATDQSMLKELDWSSLQERDFKRRADDPARFERYQAEALVYRHVAVPLIERIVTYSESSAVPLRAECDARGAVIPVQPEPDWYF